MDEIYENQDHLLLQKLSEGSVESFNILYEKYWGKVYTSAIKRLRNHDQAQDITQDIFAALWLKREELHIDNLPAYLHVAVRNKILNFFEKEKHYIPFEQLITNNIRLYGEQADAVVLRNEFLHAYKALVDSLPAERKKIFRFHYDEGLSTEEIANRLGLSRKTVQNQLGRAVTYLKTNLSHLFFLIILMLLMIIFQ
jgi:RNA polymerase sigma-70 factor (ECF subfamily)